MLFESKGFEKSNYRRDSSGAQVSAPSIYSIFSIEAWGFAWFDG